MLDPRPDPSGRRIAYVAGDTLRCVELTSGEVTTVTEPDGPEVSWGLAEFVAAEEMGRVEGYWWSPEGDALPAARVDVAAVQHIYIADPAQPDHKPREVAWDRRALTSQWFADQGFAVVVIDGRGTPAPDSLTPSSAWKASASRGPVPKVRRRCSWRHQAGIWRPSFLGCQTAGRLDYWASDRAWAASGTRGLRGSS